MSSFLLASSGTVISAFCNTKKVFDLYKDMQVASGAVDEGYMLWKLLESVEPPLQLALKLQARQQTIRHVDAAVALTRTVMKQCEALLAPFEKEDDERPESRQSWIKWFAEKKAGIGRDEQVPMLCSKLQVCVQTLQLALLTVHMEWPGFTSTYERFYYLPDASELAQRHLQEFEFGRVDRLCVGSGMWYRVQLSSVHRSESHGQFDVLLIGFCTLELRMEDTGFVLEFKDIDETDGEQAKTLAIDKEFSFQRTTRGHIVGLESSFEERKLPMYLIKGVVQASTEQFTGVLQFESANGLSMEVLESLLYMVQLMQHPKHALADVVDLEKKTDQFVLGQSSKVGQLSVLKGSLSTPNQERDLAEALEAAVNELTTGSDVPTTPLRRLSLT